MKIRVIVPVISKEFAAGLFEKCSAVARADTELSMASLDHGPASIESAYEKALATPDTVAKIVQAEKEGVDAVVLLCMCDAGLHESREKVSIPVIGAAESALHVAAMLGHKFSVLASLERRVPAFEELVANMDLSRKLASVRPVNIPVLELGDQARVLSAVVEQSIGAVREDGAHLIVFGCTGMAGLAKDAEEALRKQGIPDVPVIDPAILVLKIGEALADIGLSHSKRTYPPPPEKAKLWDRDGLRRSSAP